MLEGPSGAAEWQQAAAAIGLQLELPPEEAPELWAEHLPAVRLFIGMRSQWVAGLNGPVGLNYCALPVVEQRLGLRPRVARRVFPWLQVMEGAALAWFREQAEKG